MTRTDLIGVVDAAEIIGCSPATVKRLIASGDLPHEGKMRGATGAYLLAPSVVAEFADRRAKENAS